MIRCAVLAVLMSGCAAPLVCPPPAPPAVQSVVRVRPAAADPFVATVQRLDRAAGRYIASDEPDPAVIHEIREHQARVHHAPTPAAKKQAARAFAQFLDEREIR